MAFKIKPSWLGPPQPPPPPPSSVSAWGGGRWMGCKKEVGKTPKPRSFLPTVEAPGTPLSPPRTGPFPTRLTEVKEATEIPFLFIVLTEGGLGRR